LILESSDPSDAFFLSSLFNITNNSPHPNVTVKLLVGGDDFQDPEIELLRPIEDQVMLLGPYENLTVQLNISFQRLLKGDVTSWF